jgi:ATP-dependent RNA/DNA helicase IGHMBP2
MTDAVIRQFVAEQRELLDLELQSEQEQEVGLTQQGNDERASHILGNLDASGVSVGLYGRTVVELTAWSGESSKAPSSSEGVLLSAHRFTVGDEVEIRSKQSAGKKRYPGGVISAVSDTSVSVALFSSNKRGGKSQQQQEGEDDEDGVGEPPLSLLPKSSVEVHRKLVAALERLERHGIDHPIAGRVVEALFQADPSRDPTGNKPRHNTPFNTNLDDSQLEAISFALQDDRRISLIHGPPGTGKTTTIAELIQQAVQVHGMKVLVAAPSNVAVDNILERLVQSSSSPQQSKTSKSKRTNKLSKLRAVRLGHPARIKSSILSYSLEALVQNADGTEIVVDVRAELQSFLRVLSNPRSHPKDKRVAYREVKALRKEIRGREEKVVQELISTAQVVLTTTVGAANRILDRVEDGFDLVVIDEAAQALEASCWIPILRGKKVVLAGDHCQLPPTIKGRHRRAQEGLAKTMFERLMELYGDDKNCQKMPRVSRMLKVQYRMHHDIADWASQAMYRGELETHPDVRDRTLSQLEGVHKSDEDEEDVSETTLLLVDTAGCDMHETVNAAGSRFNQGEAQVVTQHVRKLVDMGVQQTQIAIITPYNGQVELLRTLLLPDFPKLEIRSVDGFQGGEREAVVLSLVRSSDRGGMNGIGFLKDDRRQNVAVTRAKRHLCVVCDTETVSQSKFIKNLIAWMGEHGEQRSAIELLSGSSDKHIESDLRDADVELLKMLEENVNVSSDKKKQASKPTSSKADPQLEESRRKALMDKIASFADSGKTGEEMSLSSELSSYDRRLVHELAEQIDLGHRSEGTEGIDRKVILTIQRKAAAPEIKIEPPKKDADECIAAVPLASAFTALDDDSDSDDDEEDATKPSKPAYSAASSAIPETNSLLATLAKERAERDNAKQREEQAKLGAKSKKNKKKKAQKLGGAKKPDAPPVDEGLDDLDEMAFLDAQIERSQNAHGRKVTGKGEGYRTVVNGILNSTTAPQEAPKNKKAASVLQTKLKQAQEGRTKQAKKK